MAYIGQIELTKKKPPKVEADTRAWSDLYDTLNHLIDSVNSKNTTEQRRPGDLHNSIGDITIYKDKTDNKYYMESMTEDGNARREMFISDKDNRTGDGYYSVSSAAFGGGSSGSADSRNIEQQLFEQIPWTGGIPNNIAIDVDGNLVTDTVVGATVSNNNIIESNLVGSGKTWDAGLKPKHTAIDNDGNLVLDDVVGATVTNNKIAASDIVGGGKTFTTKPPVTFRQDGIPTSLTVGDLWYDTNDGNKLYIAESVGADAITAGEWVATVDATIAIAQADADTADGKAVAAQSTADSKSKIFYQDDAPTSGMSANDVWYDTNDGNKRYVYYNSNWVAAADTTYDQATAITAAQNTAQGKSKAFYDTSAPTAEEIGDIWFKTDSNNAMYRWSGATWVSVTPDFDVNTVTIIGDTVTAPFIDTLNVNAATVAAGWVYAGTLTAGQINAQAANITGLDAGSITTGTLAAAQVTACAISSGTIDIGSGSATIGSDGATTLGNGRFHFYADGDMYIKPKYGENDAEATRRGLIFTEPLDSGGNWSEYWMMWHFSDNVFSLAYNGTPQLRVTSGGNLNVTGDLIAGDQVIFGSTVHSSYLDWADDSYDGPALHGGSDVYYFKPLYESDNYPYWGLQLGSPDNRWERLYALEVSDISSDSRWKRNIETVPLGLDFINSLNPVQYNRYAIGSEEDPDGRIIEGKHWGLIAQEVRTAMEEAGVTDSIAWHHNEESDKYSLAYSELISPMIKAIQELKAEVDALKA